MLNFYIQLFIWEQKLCAWKIFGKTAPLKKCTHTVLQHQFDCRCSVQIQQGAFRSCVLLSLAFQLLFVVLYASKHLCANTTVLNTEDKEATDFTAPWLHPMSTRARWRWSWSARATSASRPRRPPPTPSSTAPTPTPTRAWPPRPSRNEFHKDCCNYNAVKFLDPIVKQISQLCDFLWL